MPGRAAGRPVAARTEVDLDADGAERWIRVLNDLRLALGTRLGITEDDDDELDESDPQVAPRARYCWLTALQDAARHDRHGLSRRRVPVSWAAC